jgi:hypothetical protein
MGLLTRRTPAAPADLASFRAVSGALPLLATDGIAPTGVGSACIKPESKRYPDLAAAVDRHAGIFDDSTDDYGHRWLTRRRDPSYATGLVDDLATLQQALNTEGLGRGVLCALICLVADGQPAGLVFRPARGTWYPFVPAGEGIRDNVRELAIRDRLAGQLAMEPDLTKWAPVWDAPGMTPAV